MFQLFFVYILNKKFRIINKSQNLVKFGTFIYSFTLYLQYEIDFLKHLDISIIISIYLLYSRGRETEEEEMNFVVVLCHDVILDVLQHGKRKQLTLLEAVGRRFHRVIDGNFVRSPFLVLDLYFGLIFKLINSNML